MKIYTQVFNKLLSVFSIKDDSCDGVPEEFLIFKNTIDANEAANQLKDMDDPSEEKMYELMDKWEADGWCHAASVDEVTEQADICGLVRK